MRHRPSLTAVAAFMAVLVLPLSTGGCADPQTTATRGEAELQRHRNDPLLTPNIAALARVSAYERGAYVDSGVLSFGTATPTTFTRTYTTAEAPERVLAAFDAEMRRLGAWLATSTCSISVPESRHIYAATSVGDDVRISVTVRPSDTAAPISLELAVTKAEESPSVGLRDCLHRRLEPSAYISAYADRPRTDEELCALMTDGIRRAAFGGDPGRRKKTACIIKGRRNGKGVYVQLWDTRTLSLARLLDQVPPGTDPGTVRVDQGSLHSHSVLLPRLRSGALRVDSNDANVADTVATMLLSRDS